MMGLEGKKVKVLLVDDDDDDYVLIHQMLKDIRDREYQVEWANSYKAALHRLAVDEVDIVLVDYDLGERDGLELIREAVAMGVKAPIIMVTGRGRYELDMQAMENGAADYLSKNMINSAVLERVIRYSLERQAFERGVRAPCARTHAGTAECS
jgi:two-component system, cell cycle sensor histidine kinase and response regulator CckA